MKKLSMKFLMMTGLMVTIFFACNNDDEDTPTPAAPSFGTPPADISVATGATSDVTYNITTPGKFSKAEVTSSVADVATATVKTPPAANSNSGEVVVTVTGVKAGTATITLTVTDVAGQVAKDELGVTVTGDTGTPDTPEVANAGDTLSKIDGLGVLAAAIDAAGLKATLNSAAKVTIFAPNNNAIDSLIKSQIGKDAFDDEDDTKNLNALIAAITKEGVSGILQAHVLGDSLSSTTLQTSTPYQTLNPGSTITITSEGGKVFANGAEVLTPNIKVGNGYIHIIDSVINVNASAVEPTDKAVVQVASSANGVGNVTWSADSIYLLEGFVFVNSGQTLTIEPGTVIKGRPGQAARASALIVAQGGKIEAKGTAEAPIIFTAQADDLNGSVADDASGLWGGVIILGNAPTNNNDVQGVKNIEGIPTSEVRGAYGGTAADDNSGTLQYVSIRYGGSVIGANNEINGLTLGAVGSGTTIDHVEVWSNLDDGIEFFGGTVNANNLVIAYPGDDGLDADEGYSGNIQNAIVWQTSATLQSSDPRAMELDGGVGANETAQPYSLAKFANLTLVYDDGDENMANAIVFRDNSSASIFNSIIVGQDAPVAIENLTKANNKGSSYDRYVDGTLMIKGNIFYDVNEVVDPANFAKMFVVDGEKGDDKGTDDTGDDDADVQVTIASQLANQDNNNVVANPTLGTGATRFTPSADVTTGIATVPAGLEAKTYKGAVDPAASTTYFAGWSKTSAVINK